MKSKRKRRPTVYARQLREITEQYVEASGSEDPNLKDLAKWAYENGKIEKPDIDIIKILAKAFARALQQDFFSNENGDPVRHWHAYKEKRGEKQLTFWFKMEDGTPEKMRLSAQWRRRGTLLDVMQLDRDIDYFNKHYNPGDAIAMDYNFNPDVTEQRLPTEYPEAPPENDKKP
jgi:hypothetical protein